jgi:hypothetical protein
MSNTAEGYVVRIFTKTGNSARGKWVADSFKIQDDSGNEDPFFYRLGFRDKGSLDKPPAIQEGQYIRFSWTDNDDKSRDFVQGSGKIVAGKEAAPSQSPATSTQGAASGAGKPTQQNIHYQNSRGHAVELVGLLLENDALPKTGAKTAAGVAKRYDEIVEAVDKLTVKFFNDLETFRLFDTVADSGEVDTSADGALPDDELETDSPETEDDFDDDIPF